MSVGRKLVFVFLSLFVLACSETKDNFYKTIDEARRNSAFDKGWIPDILPASSREIHERHDLDTNAVWLRFKFDKTDVKGLIDQLEEIKPAEINTIEITRPNVNWWPKDLNKDSLMKNEQSALRLYKYKKVFTYANGSQKVIPAFFIIDWNANIAYYWQYAS